MNIEKEVNSIERWLQSKVKSANKDGCVVGVSGGIDSAVTLALCKFAFPYTTYGLSMSMLYNVNGDSNKRATELCTLLNIHIENKPIVPIYDNIPNRAKGNYYARQRMCELYLYAEINNLLVIGTCNKSEISIGYETKFGDHGCDINPMASFYKGEVYEFANYLNIPESIITADPSAELEPYQTDEDDFGFTYNELDKILKHVYSTDMISILNIDDESEYMLKSIEWLQAQSISTDHILMYHKIFKMYRASRHKRKMPEEYQRVT
jgi:NAD+ synthase